MQPEQFLETYGYAAVLIGTFLEGEAVLIMGGFLSHRGYLYLPGVIAAAFLGTLANGQLFYLMGRHKGAAFLERYRSMAPRVDRLRGTLHRHQTALILGFRFLYGLRTVTPLLLGTSGVPSRQYLVLNALGAAVWAVIVGVLGYSVGLALEQLLDEVRQYEGLVLGAIASLAAVAWLIHFFRKGIRP